MFLNKRKKPSKPRAKKSDKVKDMFAGMTEKEKKGNVKIITKWIKR